MAQRAQERGTDDASARRRSSQEEPSDTRRQEECGKWCEDKGEKVQYEASGRLEESTVRRGVDEREEQQCTKSKTHVGRANTGTLRTATCRFG